MFFWTVCKYDRKTSGSPYTVEAPGPVDIQAQTELPFHFFFNYFSD